MAAARALLLLAVTSAAASFHVAAPQLRVAGLAPSRSTCPLCVANVQELRAAEKRGEAAPRPIAPAQLLHCSCTAPAHHLRTSCSVPQQPST